MSEARTRFTAIGLSGSGKTCYVLGMYYQMITGYKGFSLKANGENVSRLEQWMDNLDECSGCEKFPSGTSLTEVTDYEFKLKYALKDIMTFNWIDYGGGSLKARTDNGQAYASLMQSIQQSTALYIFLDGAWFCKDDKETRIKEVKRKARVLNDYLLTFSDYHQDSVPPIVFVITKSDICSEYLDEDDFYDIMTECFGSVMTKGCRVYMTMVSLGRNISDDDYSGDVDPVGMHIPFFIGIYHQFLNFCLTLKFEIETETEANKGSIAANQEYINEKRSEMYNELSKKKSFFKRLFFDESTVNHCKSQINESMREINSANQNIENNKELMKYYKKLMQDVSSQLLRDSSNFKMFEDGKEKDFEIDDIFDL